MINTNPTLMWAKEQEFEGTINIDADIKDHTKETRGIYGFFIEDTCIYVGRSQSVYGRIFDAKGYLANLKLTVDNKGFQHEEKSISNDLFDAFQKGEKISIKILERVPLQRDNHSKDMQRLASAECKHIDYYQKNNHCLNQLPDGKNMTVDKWNLKIKQ